MNEKDKISNELKELQKDKNGVSEKIIKYDHDLDLLALREGKLADMAVDKLSSEIESIRSQREAIQKGKGALVVEMGIISQKQSKLTSQLTSLGTEDDVKAFAEKQKTIMDKCQQFNELSQNLADLKNEIISLQPFADFSANVPKEQAFGGGWQRSSSIPKLSVRSRDLPEMIGDQFIIRG
jgi:chromosome segregation ATPase